MARPLKSVDQRILDWIGARPALNLALAVFFSLGAVLILILWAAGMRSPLRAILAVAVSTATAVRLTVLYVQTRERPKPTTPDRPPPPPPARGEWS